MNSSIFSCGVIAPPAHSPGKMTPVSAADVLDVEVVEERRGRTDLPAGCPTGVSKV